MFLFCTKYWQYYSFYLMTIYTASYCNSFIIIFLFKKDWKLGNVDIYVYI